MGLLARARSVETGSGPPGGCPQAPKKPLGGLLARSRLCREDCSAQTLFGAPIDEEELEQARSAPAGPRLDAPPAAAEPPGALDPQQLLAGVQQISAGLEAPGRLFALLHRELGLTRAALLLWDPARSVFAPWTSCGLDQTTLHRLRLPLQGGGHFETLAAGEILLLEDPAQREPLRRYFSTREHATMQKLLLAPLVHDERLRALLLVTQASRSIDQDLLESLRALSPAAALLLYASRDRTLEALDGRALEAPEAARQHVLAAAQFAAARGNRLALVRVSLQSLVRSLAASDPRADTFRFSEDLHRLLQGIFSTIGGILRLESGELLLTVSRLRQPDVELLVAHLKAAVRSLLPRLQDAESLDLCEQARVCDPSAEEAAACLAELQ